MSGIETRVNYAPLPDEIRIWSSWKNVYLEYLSENYLRVGAGRLLILNFLFQEIYHETSLVTKKAAKVNNATRTCAIFMPMKNR